MGTDTQLNKGVLEGCVLKLLKNHSRYSGEIVFLMRSNGFDDFSEGTLYPMLLRLEKDGCFTVTKRESENSPPKKYYQLSEKGLERLERFIEMWHSTSISVANILQGETDQCRGKKTNE